MSPPQGLVTFPGLPVLTGASFTFTHGIMPSVLSFNTVPSTNFVPQIGDMKITFGGEEIVFKDCAVTKANLRIEGGFRWSIMIQDRRWKWKYGEISGRYNVRRDDNSIDPKTEKTPHELAQLLCEAMGEDDADFELLPNDTQPESIWEESNPASELQNLCDVLNCRIVLGLNNRVKIWPLGQGEELPANGLEMNQGFGFSRAAKPDSLKIIGGSVLVQAKFKLIAVGEDTDGSIKPINDLSYAPAAGWEFQSRLSFSEVEGTYVRDGVALKTIDLAKKCIWKWYRLEKFADDTLNIPGLPDNEITKIQSLLPISDSLLDMSDVPLAAGSKEPKRIQIEGSWWPLGDDYENMPVGSRYPDEFNVDQARGIVQFNQPVIKLDDADRNFPADLFATVVFSVKDEETGNPFRFTATRELDGPKNNTKARILKYPEIIRQIIVRYNGSAVTEIEDNQDEVQAEVDHYLDAVEKEYELDQSSEVQYAGILPIALDGAVSQVTWEVGSRATTRASKNAEHAKTEHYKQRRQREFLAETAKQQKVLEHAFGTSGERWNGLGSRFA
jgi:hypothetical protein